MKTKSLCISSMLAAALCLTLPVAQRNVQARQTPDGVTKITVNGRSADMFLVDVDTNGFLNASKDQIANTSALDFSYVFPHPTNADFVILIQGAGAIPNSSFQITSTSAHLQVTTSFPVNRCEVNLIDGTFTCAQTAPSTFDLTWVRNGIGSLFQKTTTIQTLGPVKTRIKGQFASQMANVNGMWDGHSALDQPGNVVDTEQTTVIREIRIEANP